MKKVGIDARLIGQTGVGVYIKNLLFELEKIVPPDIEFYVYLPRRYTLHVTRDTFKTREAPYHWHSLSEQIGFLRLLNKDNLDLMHFTYFSFPIFYNRPFISTIHDLTPLLFKTGRASTKNELIYYIKHTAFTLAMIRATSGSRHILTPTLTVKKQLGEHFGAKIEAKTTVTYEGVNKDLTEVKENTSLLKQYSRPFFLYVGNFYPHKNVEILVNLFKSLPEYDLLLVGPDDFFSKRLATTGNVRLHNNATLADFAFFYKHATALLHPSLSEGFGLPIVEASYFNLPIIASTIEVFDELLGKDRLKFNPRSVDSLKAAVETFIDNPEKYKNQFIPKEKLGSTFSFKKMAEETLKIYQKTLGFK